MAPTADLRVNRLLSLLPADELARIQDEFVIIDGHDHDVIYEPGGGVENVYFPLGGVISLIATDAAGRSVEMASVGAEGLVGLPGVLMGGGMIGDVVQQISGRIARIGIGPLRAELDRRQVLSSVIERYTVALLSQIGQGLVCNRHHHVESRTARWLLAAHDRVGADDFILTQDFLSVMLGATRPQVSISAGALKDAGLITYSRGHVRILDRKGLEAASCECYGIIEAEFRRLLGNGNGHGWAVGG
jgi:CRP-like cAMP-binding protein